MRLLLAAVAALAGLFAGGSAEAACPALPYTFVNGTVANATQVNANFASVLGCINTAAANVVPVSVVDKGAKRDVLTYTDGVIGAGSANFASSGATFRATDCSAALHPTAGCTGTADKLIQVNGAGAAGVTGAPLSTHIVGFTDPHHVTLADAAVTTAPQFYLGYAPAATAGGGGDYVPGEHATVTGGTSSVGAVVKVISTKAIASAVVAGGSGGVDGACALIGATGSGTVVKLNGTVAGGVLTAVSIADGGHYFVNPTNLASEGVLTDPSNATTCAPTAATVSLQMGTDNVSVLTAGAYTVTPSNPAATGAASSSGATGLTVTATWAATGSFIYGSDDTTAFQSAITQSAANFAAGQPSLVYAPTGSYLVNGATLPTMGSGLGIVGDGQIKTNIVVGADYAGDLFSWSEAWIGNPVNGAAWVTEFGGPTQQVTGNPAGPKAIGFSVIGNRFAAAQQNALVYYDRNDGVVIRDVGINFLNGRCIWSGVTKNTAQAYMRESYDIRTVGCNEVGNASVPTVEFSSEGAGGDGSNEIVVTDLQIYRPFNKGLWIRNHNADGVRDIRLIRPRIEGQQNNAGNQIGDLLVIGDPTWTGGVHDIWIDKPELLNPYNGYYALTTQSPDAGSQPYSLNVTGAGIYGGTPLGGGINIVAGRGIAISANEITTWGTNVTLGNAPLVGQYVSVDAGGGELFLSNSIGFGRALTFPVRHFGGFASGYVAATSPDNAVRGGNDRGTNSVDLQSVRGKATEGATGNLATIAGGSSNTASGQLTAIGGGLSNTAGGFLTATPGGELTFDYNSRGGLFYGGPCGFAAIPGGCQFATFVMGTNTTGVGATQLTTDGGAAINTNCINIPQGTGVNVRLAAVAHDRVTNAYASWRAISGVLFRQAGNATWVGDAGGVPDDSTGGAAATATVAVAADAGNQCLSVVWTAPNANQWDVTARVDTAFVQ